MNQKAVLIVVEGRLSEPHVAQALRILRAGGTEQETGTARKLEADNISIREVTLDMVYLGAFR